VLAGRYESFEDVLDPSDKDGLPMFIENSQAV